MGNIKKMPNGSFKITVEGQKEDGKRKRIVRYVHSGITDAKAELKRLESEVLEGKKFEASQKLLSEFLLYWVDEVVQFDKAKNTYQSYKWEIEKHINPIMGHIPLGAITPAHIQEFFTYKAKSGKLVGEGGLSPRSMEYLHAILGSALNYAVDLEYIEKNPCSKIRPPKNKEYKKREWVILTPEQLQKFLTDIVGHRDYALIYLAAHSGARQSELLGLQWKHILWKENAIDIKQALHRLEGSEPYIGKTKNLSSIRKVILSEDVMKVLEHHRDQQKSNGIRNINGLVFPDTNGGFMNAKNLSHRYSNLAGKYGYEGMTFHHLRHTHATILLSGGAYAKAVADRLGHATVETTMGVYAHVLKQHQHDLAETFSSSLLKIPDKKNA